MSNELNLPKFYQFLQRYEENNSCWIDAADDNGDGLVIKSEFKKFMLDEFDWNGEANTVDEKKDLASKYFDKINSFKTGNVQGASKKSEKSTLSDKDFETIERNIKLYEAFDKYAKENIKTDDVADVLGNYSSKWVNDVKEALGAYLESYKGDPDESDALAEFLDAKLGNIQSQIAAEYCAIVYTTDELQETLAEYPEYKVADDSTLQGIIKAYVESAGADGDFDIDTIMEDIRDIVDGYLATAELGEGDVSALEGLEYNDSALNPLQIAVLTQTIKDELATSGEDYSNYTELFNSAVEEFIQTQLASGEGFAALKTGITTKFGDSEQKRKLDNYVDIMDNYGDIDAPDAPDSPVANAIDKIKEMREGVPTSSDQFAAVDLNVARDVVPKSKESGNDFYQKLVDAFGEEIANMIAVNDKFSEVYEAILNEVIEKLNNNEWSYENDQAKIEQYIIEQIFFKLNDIIEDEGVKNISGEDLNNMYDNLANSADEITDNDESLAMHRQAAIKYCDLLMAKGGAYAVAVKDVFDANYKDAINKAKPASIMKDMEELKAKVANIQDLQQSIQWSGDLKDEMIYDVNETVVLDVADNVDGKYYFTVTKGNNIAVVQDGKLNINTGDKPGRYDIEITPMQGGIHVGEPKRIKIIVNEATNIKPIDDSNVLKNVSGYLQTGTAQKWNTAWDWAKTSVSAFLGSLKTSLINEGYAPDRVEQAITSAKDLYNNVLDGCKKVNDDFAGAGGTTKDGLRDSKPDGETTYVDAFYHIQNDDGTSDDAKNRGKADAGSSKYGICMLEEVGFWSSNEYTVIISKAKIVEKLKSFF